MANTKGKAANKAKVARTNIGYAPNAARDFDAPTRSARSQTGPHMDYSIISLVVLLVVFGLVVIYSASYYSAESTFGDQFYYMRKQAIFSLIGIVIMITVSVFDYHIFVNKKFAIFFMALATILMFLVDFTSLGIEFNGRKRWFGFAGHSLFQPTEFVKLALIVFAAYYINKYLGSFEHKKKLAYFLIACAAPILLVVKNNLSSGIILSVIVFIVFFVSCKHNKKFYIGGAFLLVALLVAIFFGQTLVDIGVLTKYQFARIGVWQNPTAYSDEGGYQVLQGLYAIGSGGFFGKGLGASTQKLGYLPEAQNDMIFSIICEELGIFGALCLMAIFAFLIYKLIKVARSAPDLKGTLVVTGVIAQLSTQVILNIAVVTNSIPNTGVSLPFISYGGSSVLFLLFEMGLVLSVANRMPRGPRKTGSRKKQTPPQKGVSNNRYEKTR